MATILQFQRAEPVTVTAVETARPQCQSAEIIIFPGVRIERHGRGSSEPRPTQGPYRPAQG
jgi:hypothetical protein